MFEQLTAPARAAVVTAQEQARAAGHPQIGTEHLLAGVVDDADGVAVAVLRGLGVEPAAVREQVAALGSTDDDALRAIGIDLDEVRRRAEDAFGPGALDRPRPERAGLIRSRLTGGHLPFTSGAKKAMELSLREALAMHHDDIGTEHLLLGLVTDEHEASARVLRLLGLTLDKAALRVRVAEERARSAGRGRSPGRAGADGAARTTGVGLRSAIPAMPVRDASAAVAYYRDRFGFEVHHHDEGFAVLRRDDIEVHLWQAGDERWRGRTSAPSPVVSGAESFIAGTASCRIQVDGVDELYDQLRASDVLHAASREGLSETDFGTREFATLDMDGNLLTFFQTSRTS